jgi:LysR substrate binding domain-containing protein
MIKFRRLGWPTPQRQMGLAAALIADQVDLILTHHPPPRKHTAIAAAAQQALCALMVHDHPLAKRSELHLRDCLAYPLALGDPTLAGRALIEQVLAQSSFDLDPRLVSDSVETMKAVRSDESRRLFSVPHAGQGSNPARRHDRAAADRSAAPARAALSGDAARTGIADRRHVC